MIRLATALMALALALLALLVVLMPEPAWGQGTGCAVGPTCTPETEHDRTKCGALLSDETATGQWSAWWYSYTNAAGAKSWCYRTNACLSRYCPGTATVLLQSRMLLATAVDLATGLADLDARFGVKPAPGTQEDFDFQTLLYKGCQAAAANPPAGVPLQTCSMAAPVPPGGTPPPVYRIPANGSAVYPLVNGLPGIAIVGRRAPGNALCGAPLVTSRGYTYGSWAGGVPTELGLCVKASS